MGTPRKRGPGRPRADDPLYGKRLGYARLSKRYPGITPAECRAARELIESGQVPLETPSRRWVLGIKVKTAYDLALPRVIAEREGMELGELWAEALRAWLDQRAL